MKIEKKNHTRASLNLYLIAGLYLLYINYSLLSRLSEIEANKKITVVISVIVFGIFAIGIISYSLKGLIAFQKRRAEIIEEMKKEEESDEVK